MDTKATQTHFLGIRPSSQEIAIFAKRPIGCTDSVNCLEDYVLVSIQRGQRQEVGHLHRFVQPVGGLSAGGDGVRRCIFWTTSEV
jgi:hypothetical protein